MLDKNNNKINFNINLKGKNIEEVLQYSPAKYRKMLTAVFMTAKLMINGLPDEKKRVRRVREGYTLGIIALLASRVSDNDLDKLANTAGITEELVNQIDTEQLLMSTLLATKEIIYKGDKVVSDKEEKKSKKSKMVKIKVVNGKVDRSDLEGMSEEEKDKLVEKIETAIKEEK